MPTDRSLVSRFSSSRHLSATSSYRTLYLQENQLETTGAVLQVEPDSSTSSTRGRTTKSTKVEVALLFTLIVAFRLYALTGRSPLPSYVPDQRALGYLFCEAFVSLRVLDKLQEGNLRVCPFVASYSHPSHPWRRSKLAYRAFTSAALVNDAEPCHCATSRRISKIFTSCKACSALGGPPAGDAFGVDISEESQSICLQEKRRDSSSKN